MAALLSKSMLVPALALILATPALAGDVSVTLDANGAFVIKNATGSVERLRVDEATGNVSRNGALFVHTTGVGSTFVGVNAGSNPLAGGGNTAFGFNALRVNTGFFDTAVGYLALVSNTTGIMNTAVGYALKDNTTGSENTAVGNFALLDNTTGGYNSAFGATALYANTTGSLNSAFGRSALVSNSTGGSNSAFGYAALRDNTTGDYNSAFGSGALTDAGAGSYNTAVGFIALHHATGQRNVAIGERAGESQTTGSDNIYIASGGVAGENGRIRIGEAGPNTAAFVAGIRGVTTANANAIPVLIDSAGQLGTVSSSRSVKREIRDMGNATARLLELRPVTFRYREQQQALPGGGEAPPEYGLIAEEVAEVFPDLVVDDEQGRPFTVKYHELAPMLLNEMQRQHRDYEQRIAALAARIEQLEAR